MGSGKKARKRKEKKRKEVKKGKRKRKGSKRRSEAFCNDKHKKRLRKE